MLKQFIRYSTTIAERPSLASVLPKKRIINRLLFDEDSRLSYSKLLPILNSVYASLDTPEKIKLPKYTKPYDLMTFKNVLQTIRTTTSTANIHLVSLENELVEQAAELGDNNAISMLAFETVRNRSKSSPEDYKYAQELIKKLTDLNHPLTYKLAGDLAFFEKHYTQAHNFWLKFTELESDTINASHVYSNLGIYYLSFIEKPDFFKARTYFEKSILYGELDSHTVKSHYYLGRIIDSIEPKLAKYHWEISASRGFKESFSSLGYLELNVFNNPKKALEWFKLGHLGFQDPVCNIGQFDAKYELNLYSECIDIIETFKKVVLSMASDKKTYPKPENDKRQLLLATFKSFFETRKAQINSLADKIEV